MATRTEDDRITMRDRMHVPRSRGATSGLLLVLLGAWGALIPLIGPWFDFAFTPNDPWNMTWNRLWLEVLPGAALVVGGLILLGATNRANGWLGAVIASAGGAWFVVGRTVSELWNDGVPGGGNPAANGTFLHALEEFTFFYGLGAISLFLAAAAFGRLSVVGVRDVRAARAAGDDRHDRHDRHDEDQHQTVTSTRTTRPTTGSTRATTTDDPATVPAEESVPQHRGRTT